MSDANGSDTVCNEILDRFMLRICWGTFSDTFKSRECPGKAWWNCVYDNMKSFVLCYEDAQDEENWRLRNKGGGTNRLTQITPENGR